MNSGLIKKDLHMNSTTFLKNWLHQKHKKNKAEMVIALVGLTKPRMDLYSITFWIKVTPFSNALFSYKLSKMDYMHMELKPLECLRSQSVQKPQVYHIASQFSH